MSDDGWFRAGSLAVTTTIAVLGLVAFSMLWWVVDRAGASYLILNGDLVRGGEVWRVVTWPFFNQVDIWTVFSGFIFFMLGTQLEMELGRKRLAWIVLAFILIPGIVGTIYPVGLAWGVQNLTTSLLVMFALRFPFARSFFNIPLWVLLVVFETVYALQIIGDRDWPMLVFFSSSLATAALVARAFDLTEFHQIPKVPLPGFISGDPYAKSNRARVKQQRQQRAKAKPKSNPFGRNEPAEVIPLRPESRPEARLTRAEQARMDELLDKISETGMDSLTADERAQLDGLSRRLRGE